VTDSVFATRVLLWLSLFLVPATCVRAQQDAGNPHTVTESGDGYLVDGVLYESRELAEKARDVFNADYRFRDRRWTIDRDEMVGAYQSLMELDVAPPPSRAAYYAHRLGKIYGCFWDRKGDRYENWETAIAWWSQARDAGPIKPGLLGWEAGSQIANMRQNQRRYLAALREVSHLLWRSDIHEPGRAPQGSWEQAIVPIPAGQVLHCAKRFGPGVTVTALHEVCSHPVPLVAQKARDIVSRFVLPVDFINPLALPPAEFQ